MISNPVASELFISLFSPSAPSASVERLNHSDATGNDMTNYELRMTNDELRMTNDELGVEISQFVFCKL